MRTLKLKHVAQAKTLKSKVLVSAKYLSSLIDATQKTIVSRGYIKTLMGRKLKNESGKEYKAINKLMQGSGVDLIMESMLLCYESGINVLFSVHDELNISGTQEDAMKAAKLMSSVFKLQVPMVVEYKETGGSNWADSKLK